MDALAQLKSSLAERYDIADGRFLGLITNGNDFQLVIVPNWRVEMEQRIAASRH